MFAFWKLNVDLTVLQDFGSCVRHDYLPIPALILPYTLLVGTGAVCSSEEAEKITGK
jgi:hypothetical protein